jgi:hypothetical protein
VLLLGLLRDVSFYPSMSVAQGVLCLSKAISLVLAGQKSVFVNVRLLLNHVSGAVTPISEATTWSFLLFFIFRVI